jgi:hypothetical protein
MPDELKKQMEEIISRIESWGLQAEVGNLVMSAYSIGKIEGAREERKNE